MKPLFILIALVTLIGCAVQTPYKGTPAADLSDEQLVEELTCTLQGLGMAIEKTQYLIAVRPEPAYVLTSSTTSFSGTMNADYNAYSMPTGYGVSTHGRATGNIQGQSSTQYHYTDVNAGEQLGNSIAIMISQSRVESFRKRGQEVWAEFRQRVETRREKTELLIQEFFEAHPELESRRLLVTAVAPWVAAEQHTDDRETLEHSKEIIENLSRGPGLNGTWYGTVSNVLKTEQGSVVSFNDFIQINMVQSKGKLTGKGKLGCGDIIEMNGQITEQKITGVVANITAGTNVSFSGITTDRQITAEFEGTSAGRSATGNVVLLR